MITMDYMQGSKLHVGLDTNLNKSFETSQFHTLFCIEAKCNYIITNFTWLHEISLIHKKC